MHLSPDGQKISLVSDKKLWIMPLPGKLGPDFPGAPSELNTEDVLVEWIAHTWSGDSKWIAFNEYPPNELNEENKGNQGIYIVSTEGGKPKKVYENYRDERTVNYRISLSPRGKTLAFSSVDLERKEQHIYTIPVDGGSPKQLVDAQAREPVFSPDGKMIAFVEDKNLGRGGGDLWVVPAQGGTPTHVADAVNASSPIWSPRGDMIAFLDYSDKRNQINFIPIGEGGRALGEMFTINAPEGIQEVWLLAGWSPDNKIGAVFTRRGGTGLYTLPAKGGKAVQIAQGGGQPRWSPDGKRIFIVARARRGTGAWQRLGIASIPAEGGSVTTVPIQSKAKIYIPYFGVGNRVSPDGKMIVFSGKTQYDPVNFLHNQIWTLPVEGGVPEQLTEAPQQSTDMFPCWSPDGKTIAFVRARIPEKIGEISDYNTNIYIVQANGGEPTSLTTELDSVNFGPIEWSPDGKFLAYFSQEDDTSSSGNLKIISANGDGKSRVIGKVRDPHPGMQFAWSPDSKRIAFDGPDGKVIKIISLEDGSIVNIETGLVDSNIGDRLDWSPDGERFVFVAGKGESSEFWVIENFLPESTVGK
jgi:Tol biopolymer transport system component